MAKLLRIIVPLALVTAIALPVSSHELSKAELKQIKKVMKTWSKALGVKCKFCHNVKDYKEYTPHKRTAHAMKAVFLAQLTHPKGETVHCSHCHAKDKHADKKAMVELFGAEPLRKLAGAFVAEADKAQEAKAKEELKEVAEFLSGL